VTAHLRFAGLDPATQDQALRGITAQSQHLTRWLHALQDLDLPDGWIVSGAIYNLVWNHLTDRPALHGLKDVDLFYFDPDTSYDAEDRAIRHAATHFPASPPAQLRNQACVHLWYPQRFGQPYPQLTHACQAIDLFSTRSHCIAARLSGEALEIYAPFGLEDMFSFRLTPNTALNNRETHHAKSARQMAQWPELQLEPWPA